jgi:hypothetical protein
MIIRTTIKSVYYPGVRPRTSALIYMNRRIRFLWGSILVDAKAPA